jgi:hypothetical protein
VIERYAGLESGARAVDEREVVVDLEVLEHRIGRDANAARARIRAELEVHGLEVHQHGARHHVVGAIRLTVERAGRGLAGRIERTIVEHEVAADVLEAGALERPKHLPKLLDDEVRVTVTLDREAAVELAAVEAAEEIDLGGPRVRGTQHLERAPGGDHLHHGRRAAGLGREVTHDRLRRVHVLDEHADLGERDRMTAEHARDFGRQIGMDRPRRDEQHP